MISHWKWLMAVGLLTLVPTCNRGLPAGPPTIHYGQDPCAGCGMIISDDRSAAALVDPAGDSAPLLFDDIGCLLDYEREHPQLAARSHYVHDATSRQWLAASAATFVKTSRETPMGSGLLAFVRRSDAEAAAGRSPSHPPVQTYGNLTQTVAAATAPR
jgi:copper chaperone NosL